LQRFGPYLPPSVSLRASEHTYSIREGRSSPMPYDLFISYSRRDNTLGRVTQLIDLIRDDFLLFAGRPLDVFFDLNEIQGMDDWRQKIQQSLRESQLFLAVLSPNYLTSPYCRWEWEDYVRYEAMRQCLSEGIAPVFFVTLPDSVDPKTDRRLASWIDEIQRRQTFDLRPWHNEGENALQHAHVKSTLEELQTSLRIRFERFERGGRSPNNLLRHNSAFVGRVRELTEVRNTLVLNKLGVIGARGGQAPGRATVQGLGGMGKTELALAYAHAFAWDYPGGRWQVGCEHIGDLRLALLQLAGPLKFEFTDDENKSLALAFERVLRELNQRERCLLLLDNISDPGILEPEYLDRLPRDGRLDLIATTRLAPRNIPGSVQAQNFIAVDELPEEDALALLRSHQPQGRFPNQEEDDCAREIVGLLEGFTLAVETAGIYLGRYAGEVTCVQFLGDLRMRLLAQSEEAAGDSTVVVRHRERLLEKTLSFTFGRLSPEALHVLNFAALLPADQIALPWLEAVGAERFIALNDAPEAPYSVFCQTTDLLLGLRLFQTASLTDADGRLLVVRMHRLVQELLAAHPGFPGGPILDRLVEYAKGRCDFLREHWLDWTNRWEIEPLRAFSELLLAREHTQASWMASSVGRRLFDLAHYSEAEPLMRRALTMDEESYGPEHPNVARDLNNQAQLLKATNRLSEAEPLMRRVIRIFEQSYGVNHPDVATALTNLAQLLQDTNRLGEAEPLMQRALAIDEQNYGPEHPEVAIDLNNLATLLQDRGQLGEAEPLMRRALAIDERSYGAEHPKVARGLNNLATLLQATNRLGEAEQLMRRVVEIMEQGYGETHPNVATTLNNLAALLKATNRLGEAEPLMRRALAIDESSYGMDHPKVARDLNNLATLLQGTNRVAEAEPLLQRALAIDEQSWGPAHPDVARDLSNIAQLLQVTNRLPEAEPLMRRVVKIFVQFRVITGHEHPHLQAAIENYARLLRQIGQSEREIQAQLNSVGEGYDLSEDINEEITTTGVADPADRNVER
jgi:tetratricopeptide (TPR) repeat protein